VLSNGEKIPPTDMELALALDPLFEQVMVVGEGRPTHALLVLNADHWATFAAEQGVDAKERREPEDGKGAERRTGARQAGPEGLPGLCQDPRVSLSLDP